jgi:hypothetical protein
LGLDNALPQHLFEGNRPWSVCMWVSIPAPDATYREAFTRWDGAYTERVTMVSHSSGKYLIRTPDQVFVAGALSAGLHFLVGTYDGASLTLYEDGVPVGAGASAGAFVTADGSLSVMQGLAGTCDEVVIFARALNAGEVARLYAIGTGTLYGLDGACQALAARMAITPAPAGYDAIRLGTADLPNQMVPLPAVLVFPDDGEYETGNGTRTGSHGITVRFYYNQSGDLPRDTAALRAWHDALSVQLRDAAQLGGIVTSAAITGYKLGSMSYAGSDYSGIEYKVRVIISEAWSAAS